MKNIILAAFMLLAVAANAQNTEEVVAQTSTTTVEVPGHLKNVSSDNIQPRHFLPAVGEFSGSGPSKENVTVTVDPENIGIVWVEGLGYGKFKALMKQRPAVYKVPAQKTEAGKSVPEGTLYFDAETNELKIFLGKTFDDSNPAAAFTAVKPGKSQFLYSGQKMATQE